MKVRRTDKTPGGTAFTDDRSSGWGAVSRCPRWLVAGWVSLFAISTLALVLYIVGIPVYSAWFSTLCTNCVDERLTPAKVQALHTLGISITAYAVYWTAVNLLFALVYFVVAAFIFWRKPADRVALFACFSLVALGASFPDIPNALVALHPAWQLPVALLDALGLPTLTAFLFLFPNGHFVPSWSRWVAVGFAALYALSTFFPGSILSFTHWPRLLTLPVPLIWLGSLVFAQVYRYRRVSTPQERQQTKWVVFGATITLLGLLLLAFLPLALLPLFFPLQHLGLLSSVFLITSVYLLLLLIPLTIAIAILRYRLWDIDIIINCTLVYGLLTVSIGGLYILVVVSLGKLLQAQGNLLISLFATGIIALLFQPLRAWLQRSVNRLMYGQRDEPYAVVTRLSQHLEGTLAPGAVLPTIVETIAQALKLPYVAISLQQDASFAVVANYGKPIDHPLILPLTYQGETVGQLLLSPRAPGEAFTSGERRLLDELARHAGLAVHAVRLTADLQRSRERLVTAREEERRRLRRDLHDGLGSALTSVMFKLDATDELLDRDPGTARALLTEVRAQMQASIDDIRRLVYNLRPPILDEWGLVDALREHVTQYNLKNVQVSLDAPLSLPPLPAALEVAVYRIVLEALANVIKHTMASTCTIRLRLMDEALTVEVQDDGLGRPASCHAGVGMTAMRERAEELGGWCVVEDAVPHGTRVFARVPLRKE